MFNKSNKKIIMNSFFIFFLGANAFAGGGDLVNNGGGIAEKNILFANEKIGSYISMCLKSEICKLSKDQLKTVESIYQGLVVKGITSSIKFLSEKKSPGTFIIDGLVRVAKTGNWPGAPIFINTDLLYTQNVDKSFSAVTISEAVAILIHELGHHYSNDSHESLDLIGVKVSLQLQKKLISTPLLPWNENLSVIVFNNENGFPDVLILSGQDMLNLSSLFMKQAICDMVSLPMPFVLLPDITLVTSRPQNSMFYNVHWENFEVKGDKLTATVIGNVSNGCLYSKNAGVVQVNDYKMTINFSAVKINGQWQLSRNSIGFEQVREPWYKIIKLPF